MGAEHPSPIDPDATYTIAGLAERLGMSDRYLYDLCRSGLLRHQRSRPDGRGRIRIPGTAWLDYARRCERGGEPEPEPEPELATLPRPGRRRTPEAVDPIAEYERAAGRLV